MIRTAPRQLAVLAMLGLAGWAELPAALAPRGEDARAIADLFWGFFWVCAIVWLIVVIALLAAMMRRRGAGDEAAEPLADRARQERRAGRVVAAAIALTVVTLIVLTVLSYFTNRSIASVARDEHLKIRVTGHQWWWEVVYDDPKPERQVATANEIHVPVGEPVELELLASDVIHSFWVPSLAGKKDLIPGRQNSQTLLVERPGVYRGQCAEFCGLQHANMHFQVIAQPSADFDTWVSEQQRPAPTPTDTTVERGQQLFLGSSCVYCHTVSGTNATGAVGPDLTHVASRTTLAAGTIANTPDDLARWIADPQSVKPGTQMPGTTLTPEEMQELVAYLESLG
jgi:cytochrome c oxidase subunit II